MVNTWQDHQQHILGLQTLCTYCMRRPQTSGGKGGGGKKPEAAESKLLCFPSVVISSFCDFGALSF